MDYISMIMSGLALLAVAALTALIIIEKKRNQKRNTALMDYVDREIREGLAEVAKLKSETEKGLMQIDAEVKELRIGTEKSLMQIDVKVTELRVGTEKGLKQIDAEVAKLKSGTEPDYEAAVKAASAVNDFNRGISEILGFDPYEAYQKEKQRDRMGGDVS